MANLGNAWHIPNNPEPEGRAGMRLPVGAIIPEAALTIISGNQFQGPGNSGNQLQIGSNLFFKRTVDANWTNQPMVFDSVHGNNKYFSATIPMDTLQPGDQIQYYLLIAYSDHDPTFLCANGAASATVAVEASAQATPFTVAMAPADVAGQWSGEIPLKNVPIHTHVLPNGKVLYWGRRTTPGSQDVNSLNEHETHTFIWDPATQQDRPANTQPQKPIPGAAPPTSESVNLFCSGHTFLPDGGLMVVGGHLFDSIGVDQATIFDYKTETWAPSNQKADPAKSAGRWYPSVVTLADGSVLVCSGSHAVLPIPDPPPAQLPPGNSSHINDTAERWDGVQWKFVTDFNGDTGLSMPLFPRLHVAPDGRLFMAGGLAESFFLSTNPLGKWTVGPTRTAGMARDYAPSVMYEAGKIVFIGGGLDDDKQDNSDGPPTNIVEAIDLNQPNAQWQKMTSMNFPRRQHNAMILPDGTVLVTGGTRGTRFNNLDPGQPVHQAELWDPVNDTWTVMSAERFDRCYHSTSVLLPDATVLSAGGGEYAPEERKNDNLPNFAKDSLANAQVFSPPYLFKKAQRPVITGAPDSVNYGQAFNVEVDAPLQIRRISWIRLPSVTHSFDQNQRLNFLDFVSSDQGLRVTAPPNANVCPPGHYMLFVLDSDGVPSVAAIVQIAAVAAAAPVVAAPAALLHPLPMLSKFEKAQKIASSAKFPPVRVGVTATCPYGISACWGGAHEALQHMSGVDIVRPYPNSDDSMALVYMKHGGLPDVDAWAREFAHFANGIHHFRGVEVRLEGSVREAEGRFFLAATADRPEVALAPIMPEDKIQWDHSAMSLKPLTSREIHAYQKLVDRIQETPGDPSVVRVIGPLKKRGSEFVLSVRIIEPLIRRIAHAPLSQLASSAKLQATAEQRGGLAPGFSADSRNDLSFNGGKTIADLSYQNFFVGKWAKKDHANIDATLAAVMTDAGMNDILAQYFPGQQVRATALPSKSLPSMGSGAVNRTDVENLLRRLHLDGDLGGADFSHTVFNFLLPRGVFLTTDDGAAAEDTAEMETAAGRSAALAPPREDDADDSRAGLGGYHGSISAAPPGGGTPTTLYYAVGVFSEDAGGVRNGIPVFAEPWKNVVATFYHELTEARTDPDVELGNKTGSAALFGWVNANGEIGDIPIDLASDISQVIKEITLANGQPAPVQLMYSNRVHGPEQPSFP
ncbi:hypothetical protein CCAX7_009850 [Capsulimonas corticalis]|uniref:Uncharacterized protein n=1 Tax=Capsulimonas corticalis TaxID=2219043 RepID=A0A402CUE4_9BACT|nr:galactose oxidase early set domain-containing protein [Capsulimonas corticalis]BDI28934.1 hypothetical protein CCAX7_009850 [Capsulimonas corticalis]